jgi:hypothetical protein
MSLLVAGPLLIDRLKARCPSVGDSVFSTADLAGVAEKSQVAPALHVVLYGYTPEQDNAGDVLWDETYLVVAVVKHAARKDRSQAQQDAAAPLLAEVLAALSGWRLPASGGVSGVVTTARGPRPDFSDTHAYFPLAFQVRPVTPGCEKDY